MLQTRYELRSAVRVLADASAGQPAGKCSLWKWASLIKPNREPLKTGKSNPPPDLDPYKDDRNRTYEMLQRMELEYDKALLILHPLGISVTSGLLVALWNNHATITPFAYLCMYLAWVAWLVGIVATLASFRISVALHQRVLRFLLADQNPTGDDGVESGNRWNTRATYCSGIAFVTGVLLAAISLIIISTTGAKVRKGPRLPLNPPAANFDSDP
jgi:hypothetical protein